jgi:hypothetical protein
MAPLQLAKARKLRGDWLAPSCCSGGPLHTTTVTLPDAALPPTNGSFSVGALVRLSGRPEYLKTADPMPMLRPSDLVDAGEVGQVVALRAMGRLAVRFRRGTFLLGPDQVAGSAEAERPSG